MIKSICSFTIQGDRPAQEDSLAYNREKGNFAVADGFGGPIAGAEASKLACDSVKGFLEKEAGDHEATMPYVLRSYLSLAGNVLFNALIHANRKVMHYNQGKNVNERGGASVIAGFVDGDLLALANVGCCSAWMIRDGRLQELVIPRSYARLCDPMSIESPHELKVPLMAVGIAEDLEPEIFEFKLKPEDWVLFHTDGISQVIREKIAQIQTQSTSPEDAIIAINRELKETNTESNTSIILAFF